MRRAKKHLLPFPRRLITNLNDANPNYLYHPSNAHRSRYQMMKKLFFILLVLLASSAPAEVIKCQLESGKIIYQSKPCEAAVKQQAIEIKKPDPRKVAEGEAKLKAWKEDYANREAARIKAEKELQAELDRKASVEALKKSAEYQQQQAYEAKRQADALEQQNMQPIYQPYLFYPSSPTYPTHRHHHHDDGNAKTVTNTQRKPR